MNLTDLAGKGVSVAYLLHLCSKNATVEFGFLSPPISTPDVIKRRFNGVLARFTISSILLEPGPALGLGLLGVGPVGLN